VLSIVWLKSMQRFFCICHTCNIVCTRPHRSSSCFCAAHPLSTRRWLAAPRIANRSFRSPHLSGCTSLHSLFATSFQRTAAGAFTLSFHLIFNAGLVILRINIRLPLQKIKKEKQVKAFHFRIARSSPLGFAKIISTLRAALFQGKYSLILPHSGSIFFAKTLTTSVFSLLQNAFFFHFFRAFV